MFTPIFILNIVAFLPVYYTGVGSICQIKVCPIGNGNPAYLVLENLINPAELFYYSFIDLIALND